MNNLLLYLGALAIAVLAALFAVPAAVDWNGYRGVFEEEASRILGREVRVGGGVSLRVLPMPSVSFEKIRIADTAAGAGEPFFRADAFRMWLSIAPLLRGVLEATEVELKKPVLRLGTDEDGVGNWTRLSLTPGSLPFVPAGVTLQQVRIEKGTIAAYRPDGSELVRLDAITGELSADALHGPVRFKGTLKVKGAEGDARLVTSEREADGGWRFRATWKETGADSNHQFDGRLVGLGGPARLEGELISKFVTSRPPAANGKVEPGSAEFKAKIAATPRGARFGDFSFTLDETGQPQLVTGEAQIDWTREPKIDVTLASRLFDLDRLSGTGPGATPLGAARAMVQTLLTQLAVGREVNAAIAIDQATLGGEAVSGLKLRVARGSGPLRIEELRAGLPGGARLDLSGTIGEGGSGPTFDGEVGLRGTSLFRFLAWGLARAAFGAARADGPFAIDGRVSVSDAQVELAGAHALFDGQSYAGSARYRLGTTRRLDVELEGDVIDVTQFRTGGVTLSDLLALAKGEPLAKPAGPAAPSEPAPLLALDLATDEAELRIKATEVDLGPHVLRDVAAHVILGRGSIAFPRLKLATQEGLGVDVEGNLDGLGAKPRGHVAGTVSAATPAALSKLLRLVEVAETEGPTEKVLDAVLPFRLAGRLDLGTRIETAADLTFDGLVKGRRATGAVLLDGGRDSWREAACDISLQLDHPDAVSLIGLVTGRAPAGSGGRTARPGKVVLKAVGTPSAGLLSLASVQADGLELAYHGQVTMVGDVASSIDGELDIKAQSAEDALALAGLTAGNAIAGRPVEGLVDIVSQGDRLTLAPQQVAFGGTEVSGQVTITRPAGKPAHISGDLTADAATVPGLLSAMLERSAGRPTDVPPSVWPDQLFDFSSTERINGQLGLTVARLELEPGLAARDVRLVLRVQPGRLSVDDIAGEALGGKLGGQLRFERVPGATTLEGTLAIARARLETLAVAGTPPRATGEPLDLSLGFSGRAASPAALVVALKGKGEARLGAAHMTGFAPASVARGIDALLVAKAEINAETLGKALAQSLPTGQLPLGPSEIPIEIVDGAARVAPFTVESPEGRTTVRTTVDLSTLQVDAEWRIEASAGFRSLLPAVSVVYVGKLRDAASLEPRVQTGSLERELAVRKMERDVEELERLRKADEERARQEQERQRQEQERQRQEAERVRQEQERLRALQQLPPQQPPPVAPAPPPAQGTSRPAGAIDTPGGWGAAAIPAPPQPGEPAAAQNGAAPPGSTAAPPQPVPPAPRPAARPQPKRSPGEEVLRQLGP